MEDVYMTATAGLSRKREMRWRRWAYRGCYVVANAGLPLRGNRIARGSARGHNLLLGHGQCMERNECKEVKMMISRSRKSVEDAHTKYMSEVDKMPEAIEGSLH